MERRVSGDRRQDHVFVANDRRSGPYDRRNASSRLQAREAERAKIERIRAFKQKEQTAPKKAPLLTKQRLVYLGVALLIIVIALFLMN